MNAYRPSKSAQQQVASGIVSQTATSVTKNGSHAHSFQIGGVRYSLFSDDPLHPLIDGESVRFAYREIKKSAGRYTRNYRNVVPDTLELVSEQRDAAAGVVYILSNPSMPGLIKIGYTLGTGVERAAQLSASTGVPTAFRVEWELSVPRDPRAVEQSAHAILRKRREGKEFFRASVEDGRRAVEQAFSISDPDAAASHAMLDADAAELRQRREERMAALKAAAEDREKRRIEAEEKRRFDNSPEGRFLRSGRLAFKLSDFDPDQPRGRAGFLDRLRGRPHPYSIDIRAELIPCIAGMGNGVTWSVRKEVWQNGERTESTSDIPYIREIIPALRSVLDSEPKPNCRVMVTIPNNMLQDPVPLAEAPDPLAITPIEQLREYIEQLRLRDSSKQQE